MRLDNVRQGLVAAVAQLDMRTPDEVLVEAVDQYFCHRSELAHLSTLNEEERRFLQNLIDNNPERPRSRANQDIYPQRQWSSP